MTISERMKVRFSRSNTTYSREIHLQEFYLHFWFQRVPKFRHLLNMFFESNLIKGITTFQRIHFPSSPHASRMIVLVVIHKLLLVIGKCSLDQRCEEATTINFVLKWCSSEKRYLQVKDRILLIWSSSDGELRR